MADDLVASLLQGRQHRLVALDHLALQVEAEVHGRRVFIEVGVSILELFELAIDLAQLLVDLGQLERSQPSSRSARTFSVTSVRWQRRWVTCWLVP